MNENGSTAEAAGNGETPTTEPSQTTSITSADSVVPSVSLAPDTFGDEPEVEAPESIDEIPTFDLASPFVRTAKIKRPVRTRKGVKLREIEVTHVIARPSFDQCQARDLALPYRTKKVAKKEDEVLLNTASEVDVKLYNKCVIATEGYPLNVTAPNEDGTPSQTPEEREAALAESNIPNSHKVDIMRACLEVKSEVVYDDAGLLEDLLDTEEDEEELSEAEAASWGDNIEYRVRSEIGDQGQFVVYTTVREPKQPHIDAFSKGVKYHLETGGKTPVTKLLTALAPARDVYKSLKLRVEGFSVNGEQFDPSNREHVRHLEDYGYYMRSVVDAVITETKLDMGNL
jgi:hypothetical protein